MFLWILFCWKKEVDNKGKIHLRKAVLTVLSQCWLVHFAYGAGSIFLPSLVLLGVNKLALNILL